MNCNDILERIGDYLDSELDGAERKQVRAHLESCAECQRAYTEVASIKRVVQTKIVQPPLPGALAGRVFRKTRSEAASRRTAVSVRRALPAIAALLLFGLTTFLVIRVWVIGELPLAHARAIKDMTDKYGEFKEIPRPDPELFGKSSEEIPRPSAITETIPSKSTAPFLTISKSGASEPEPEPSFCNTVMVKVYGASTELAPSGTTLIRASTKVLVAGPELGRMPSVDTTKDCPITSISAVAVMM